MINFFQKSNRLAALKSSSHTTAYHNPLVQTKLICIHFLLLSLSFAARKNMVKLDAKIEISHLKRRLL